MWPKSVVGFCCIGRRAYKAPKIACNLGLPRSPPIPIGNQTKGVGKLVCDARETSGRDPIILPYFHRFGETARPSLETCRGNYALAYPALLHYCLHASSPHAQQNSRLGTPLTPFHHFVLTP
jgi:hypothetical protein